jgi:hypothetical protein
VARVHDHAPLPQKNCRSAFGVYGFKSETTKIGTVVRLCTKLASPKEYAGESLGHRKWEDWQTAAMYVSDLATISDGVAPKAFGGCPPSCHDVAEQFFLLVVFTQIADKKDACCETIFASPTLGLVRGFAGAATCPCLES